MVVSRPRNPQPQKGTGASIHVSPCDSFCEQWQTLVSYWLVACSYSKCFISVNSLNPHWKSEAGSLLPHFADEEAEARGRKLPAQAPHGPSLAPEVVGGTAGGTAGPLPVNLGSTRGCLYSYREGTKQSLVLFSRILTLPFLTPFVLFFSRRFNQSEYWLESLWATRQLT